MEVELNAAPLQHLHHTHVRHGVRGRRCSKRRKRIALGTADVKVNGAGLVPLPSEPPLLNGCDNGLDEGDGVVQGGVVGRRDERGAPNTAGRQLQHSTCHSLQPAERLPIFANQTANVIAGEEQLNQVGVMV